MKFRILTTICSIGNLICLILVQNVITIVCFIITVSITIMTYRNEIEYNRIRKARDNRIIEALKIGGYNENR